MRRLVNLVVLTVMVMIFSPSFNQPARAATLEETVKKVETLSARLTYSLGKLKEVEGKVAQLEAEKSSLEAHLANAVDDLASYKKYVEEEFHHARDVTKYFMVDVSGTSYYNTVVSVLTHFVGEFNITAKRDLNAAGEISGTCLKGIPYCPAAGCSYDKQCLDNKPGTDDYCDWDGVDSYALTYCVHEPNGLYVDCTSNAQCDDGNPCTYDTCGAYPGPLPWMGDAKVCYNYYNDTLPGCGE